MARYLLVEIDSNTTADRLRAQIDNAGEAKGMRVVGMFSLATQSCECAEPAKHPIHNTIIDTRGARMGWMICPNCGKPRSGAHQTLWNMLDPRRGTHQAFQIAHLSVRWVKNMAGRLTTDWGQDNG